MNRIAAARIRLTRVEGVPAVLAAAYDAFEDILLVVRHHEERAGTEFPAFVLAALDAASGRDWIGDAPSLPPLPVRPHPAAGAPDLLDGSSWAQVALEVAGLAQLLAEVLAAAAVRAGNPQDRACCQQAATFAGRVRDMLGGAPQP